MKKLIFSSVFLSVVSLSVLSAQDAALFTVTPGNKVCLGTTIQVTDLSTGGNGDVTYTFGDGMSTTPPNPNPSHTYTTVNTFNLRQILPISGTVIDPQTGNPVGYMSYTLPITVVSNANISANYSSLSNNEVQFTINDSRFDSYEVDFGDGSSLTSIDRNTSGSITTFNHTFPSSTVYSVSIKVKFSAGNTCPNADVVMSVSPVLIAANEEHSAYKSIDLYPNPLKQGEALHFNTPNFNTSQIIVYSSSGDKVLESEASYHDADFSKLQPGLYLVKLLNDKNEFLNGKLIIK